MTSGRRRRTAIMTRRSRAREIAVQLLFWRDMNPTSPRPAVEQFVQDRLHDPDLKPFSLSLYDAVVNRASEIDDLLRRAAENWRLPRMAGVDRNILRLGTAELLAADEHAPAAVVINEAIELARRYGSKDSPAFVNGVLDKVNEMLSADGGPRTAETPTVSAGDVAKEPLAEPVENQHSTVADPQ
jgi:N utilization substance protein B